MNRSLYRSVSTQVLPLPYPKQDFTGKVVIITGANTGLGLEAARHFVRLGASKVILGCRSLEKGNAAKENIRSTNGDANVEVWQVDLESFNSVKAFCRRAASLDRLDVLIASAGLLSLEYKTAEGYERLTTVNVLSTWLMVLLMLPVLRATGAKFKANPDSNQEGALPHVVVVSSNAHFYTPFEAGKAPVIFEHLKGDSDMPNRYADTKLIAVLVARELAKQMSESKNEPGVVLNIVEPGYCQTELFRSAGWGRALGAIMKTAFHSIGRTPEMGSRTYVFAAAAGSDSHGVYLEDCKPSTPHKFVESDEGGTVQTKVFGELIGILETIEPGIANNI